MKSISGALVPAILLTGALSSAVALGANNDFALWKLGPPDPGLDVAGYPAVPYSPNDQERFARFVSELALVITPLPCQPPSSIGEAGFEISLSEDIADIHRMQTFANGQVQAVWPTVGTTPNQMFITTLHLRKGLPLSLELDADVSYLGRSSLVIPTVALKWTLLEGIKYVPDIAIRAFVSVLVGAPDMTVVTGGWDLTLGYRFPIIGSSEIAVYVGYQMVGLDATTTNIPFDPNHIDNTQPNSDDDVFTPLNIGDPLLPSTRFSRIFFGAEYRYNILIAGMDFGDGFGTNSTENNAGTTSNFSTQMWKFGFRLGVAF
jgi:hypothetical protein